MKRFNGIIIIKVIFFIVFCLISCNNPKKGNFKLYDFLNQDYLPLLDKNSFPRNLYERVRDIKYWEADTIIINGLNFYNPGDHRADYFDHSSKWNFDSLKNCKKVDSMGIVNLPTTTNVPFRGLYGKGLVILSKPIISDSFLLLKEYRKKSNLSESYENEEHYLIFKKNKNKWELKLKKKIEVMY
jgi:hypothetical protein